MLIKKYREELVTSGKIHLPVWHAREENIECLVNTKSSQYLHTYSAYIYTYIYIFFIRFYEARGWPEYAKKALFQREEKSPE